MYFNSYSPSSAIPTRARSNTAKEILTKDVYAAGATAESGISGLYRHHETFKLPESRAVSSPSLLDRSKDRGTQRSREPLFET